MQCNIVRFVPWLLVMMLGLEGGARLAAADPCDPAIHVSRQGLVFTVLPSGGDDTACLQYALDHAAAVGPGATVQLAAGTFKTAQLFVMGLRGAVRGQGMGQTIIRNLDTPLPMPDPDLFWYDLVGPDNPWPWLISVVGGDVVVADLAVRVVGVMPFGDWYGPAEWGGFGPVNIALAAVGVQGSETAARFERMSVAGQGDCAAGTNLNVGVGLVGPEWGTTLYKHGFQMNVEGLRFASLNYGVFTEAIADSLVAVTRSDFDATVCLGGYIFGDVRTSQVTVAQNEFRSPVGVDVFAGEMPGLGIEDSSILVRNNAFFGKLGVWMESNWMTGGPMFTGHVKCAFVGNNVQHVTEVCPFCPPWIPLSAGYYLEPPIHGCVVVGHGKGTVVDLGWDNVITGVTKQPAVGQFIAPLLRLGMGLSWP